MLVVFPSPGDLGRVPAFWRKPRAPICTGTERWGRGPRERHAERGAGSGVVSLGARLLRVQVAASLVSTKADFGGREGTHSLRSSLGLAQPALLKRLVRAGE